MGRGDPLLLMLLTLGLQLLVTITDNKGGCMIEEGTGSSG